MSRQPTYEELEKKIEELETLEKKRKTDDMVMLRRLSELSIDMLCVADLRDGHFKYVNKAFDRILGYSKKELLNKEFIRFVHPDDTSLTISAVENLSNGKPVIDFHNRYRCKDGSYKWLAWSAMPVPEEDLIYAVARDITEHKQIQEILQREQDFIQAVLNNIKDGIVACNAEGILSLFNRATRDFHGLPEEPIPADEWAQHYDLYLSDGKTRMTKEDVPLFRALEGAHVHNIEMMIAPKEGKRRVLLANGQPLFDTNGKKLGAVVSMHDITEQKQIEEELRKSERRVSMALEGADEGLWDYYPKTNEAYFSPRYYTMLGYEIDEFPHRFESWTRLLHPHDRPDTEKRVQDFLENHEEQYTVEFRMQAKDGGWRWILSRGKAVEWNDDGSVTRMIGTHKDISERKEAEEELKKHRDHLEELIDERTNDLQKANEGLMEEIAERRLVEEALRESERKYRDLVESANSIILRWDVEGNITYLNPYGLDLFGYKWEEVVGRNVVGTIVPETESFTERDLTLLMQDIQRDPNKYKNNENENLRKDGKRIWVSWTNRAVLDKEGKPVEILSIGNDITARKNLETQLQRVEKMEAIGTLAGGIAHDLNNILSGIVSYPDLLLMQLPEESPLREPIQVIQKSGDKAAAIVQDMMTLSRRGVAMKEVVNLNGILREYQESPEFERLKSLHPNVEVETELETHLLNIKGAHVQLSTTIMNLVVNAVEAMPEGGRLFVSTENRYMDSPVSGYEDVEEGDYVVLTVSDTGIGIAPEDMNRIFEPFYSSKKMGRSGTGLGMAVVWGIVKDLRGYVDVKSTVEQGSTFSLYFPATRKKQSEESKSVSVDDYKGRGESILIIDDVEEQRQIASSILSELGYSVASVSSGEEAVEYMEDNTVDLLLLDMIMEPGMDGLDTYRRILERQPRQRAVIASGYSETERVKEAQRLGAGPYVKKPYVLETIGLAVRNELDRE